MFDQISKRVFEIMRAECLGESLDAMCHVVKTANENDDRTKSMPFESYKKRTTVVVKRRRFIDVVCDALAEYKYVSPNQRADFVLACRYFNLPSHNLAFFVVYACKFMGIS